MNVYFVCINENETVFAAVDHFMVHGAENLAIAMQLSKTIKFNELRKRFCQNCGGLKKPNEPCVCAKNEKDRDAT